MIAYLLETKPFGDYEIATELDDYAGATIVHTLELTASYDHGLRTADETAFIVGCEAAASVLVPILCAVWNRPVESFRHDVDYAACLPADVPYSGDGWADDLDTSEALHEWSDEMVDAAQSVGWVVDTSSDCGMTWFYRPLPAPKSAWRTVADDEYLGEMVAAYVECALWADPPTTEHDWDYGRDGHAAIRQCRQCGERETYWNDEEYPDNPCRGRDFDADDMADDAMATIREECRQFTVSEARDLAGMEPEQAGHDFYLTRNGHGAGFWDRGLGERGERLADAARVWGSSELYAGDDGKLYAGG